MTTINIYTPVGEKYLLHGSADFPITDKCERSAKIMGDDYVRLVFNQTERVVFSAFSYIEYQGQTFFLPEEYRPTPNGTEQFGDKIFTPYYAYDVKFVSIGNMLSKHICYRDVRVQVKDEETLVTTEKQWYEPEININGTLDTLYIIIVNAINRAANEYADFKYGKMLKTIHTNGLKNIGVLEPMYVINTDNVRLTADTDLLTFNFSGDNIANVCTSVANSYTEDEKETEWYITEVDGSCTLHFAKCISDEVVQVFDDYNKGKLKKVEYSQPWSGIPQVFIPFGSDRNMTYAAAKGVDINTNMLSTFGKRLRLEPNATYEFKDKDGNDVVLETNAFGGVVNNLVNTGIEQVQFYDDIYPQCHFKVTKVSTRYKTEDGVEYPVYTITAVAIDSEDNELNPNMSGFYPIQIEEGKTLSIRFESGILNGREFEVKNNSSRNSKEPTQTDYTMCVTIVAEGSIEEGTLIPSGNFKPNINDEFALFNMKMPQVYIDYAKRELAMKAHKELLELQTKHPDVKCYSNPTNFNGLLGFGNKVRVLSELFNNERAFESRMVSFSYKLTKPSDVQFTLASAIMQGTLSQLNNAITSVTNTAAGLEQKTLNLSRRGYRDMSEVSEMIDSLASEMMIVGNEKYQFAFNGSFACIDNQQGVFDCLKVTSGTLQHTQLPYTAYANGGWWQISGEELRLDAAQNPLDPTLPYYLYADCHDDTQAAPLLLSNVELEGEQYMLLGILSSEYEGKRVFNRTNGFSSIAGGTITTEQIQDANRELIVDFLNKRIIARYGAEIIGNVKFMLPDGTIKDITDYDYLIDVLHKGYTQIVGGLVLTNVLALKDVDNETITAGMSGVINDNILLWGGGTYKEAESAAQDGNDYYTQSGKRGRQITSLLKKDGQGKIGIFKISDTQAVVKTKDGCSITIDANTGEIDVKDEEGIERTRVTSKSLNEVIKIEENERFLPYHQNGYPDPLYEELRHDKGQDLVYFQGVNKMTMLHDFTVADTAFVTLDAKVNYYSSLGGFREGYEGRFRLIVEEDEGRTETKYIDLGGWWDLEEVRTGYSDYEIAKPPFIDQEMSFAFGLPRGEYSVYGIFEVRDKVTGSTDLSDVQIDITTYLKPAGEGANLIEKDYPHTILANDGVFSHKNSSQYFKIINSGERQKIYAKGLSDGTDREAGSGELYVTSSFVNAFVSFLDEFYSYVEMVRTIGGNNENADNMQDKIKTIKDTLKDSSGNRITNIIASS